MYLLIYSIDCIYPDYEFGDDVHEGEKYYLTGETKKEVLEKLHEETASYVDEFGVNTLIENEYIFLQTSEYRVNQEYLTIHDFYEVNDAIDFNLKDTKEFKDFVVDKVKKEQKFREAEKKLIEEKLEKQEREELKRLKEKYGDI